MTWERAVEAWQVLLGENLVETAPAALRAAETATFATDQYVPVILYPETRDHVAACLQIAREYGIPLSPISRGKNWGYGSRVPAVSGAVLLSLERMVRILDFDEDMAAITLESGVSFRQAQAFLKRRGSALHLPMPGSTLDASVIGHALERGLAAGLDAERAHQITALEILLPDGRVIRTGFGAVVGSRVTAVSAEGLGPDVTGLFLQSNLGIVLSATIWLTPRPHFTRRVVFSLNNAAGLTTMIDQIQWLKREQVITASVVLYNDYKALTYTHRHPHPPKLLRRTEFPTAFRETLRGAVWLGETAVYAPTERAGWALCDEVEHRLKDVVNSIEILPDGVGGDSSPSIESVYWRKPGVVAVDPDMDGCGLIWICAVVPLRAEDAARALTFIENQILDAQFEPVIGMQVLTFRKAIIIASILYDRAQPGQDMAATACYRAVQQQLIAFGYPPYRMGLQNLGVTLPIEGDTSVLLQQIKQVVDPSNVIAPGRYS